MEAEDDPKEMLDEVSSLLVHPRTAQKIGAENIGRVNKWVKNIRTSIKQGHKAERSVIKYYCKQLLTQVSYKPRAQRRRFD